MPHRALPTNFACHLARELEHLPVEQEEAGEPELVDQHELLLESLAHAALVTVQAGVAFRERALADSAELRDRRLVAVVEVGVAVPELLRQVEREPLGELARPLDGVAVAGEALEHVGGRSKHRFVIAAPFALTTV